LTGETEVAAEGRKLAKAEIRFTADSELSAEGKKVATGQAELMPIQIFRLQAKRQQRRK